MRRIVTYCAEDDAFYEAPLPGGISGLGGMVLAETLAPDAAGRPALIFAPGLLAGCAGSPASRCTVASLSGAGQPAFSSAGGQLAPALARHGIAALFLQGEARGEEWRDLIIDAQGMRAVPSCCAGMDVPEALRALALRYPRAVCFAAMGRAGEEGYPFASLTFGSRGTDAVSRAGNGAGKLLGGMRIRAIVVQAPEENKQGTEDFSPLRALLADAVRNSGAGEAKRCTGCTPGCAFRPKDARPGGKAGKWPGYAEAWSRGEEAEDRENVRRFTAFCNGFGLDAFALAALLKAHARGTDGMPASAREILDALEGLPASPDAPLALLLRTAGAPKPAEKRDARKVLLDSLGLCSFAAQPFLASDGAWQAFCQALSLVPGLGQMLCRAGIGRDGSGAS